MNTILKQSNKWAVGNSLMARVIKPVFSMLIRSVDVFKYLVNKKSAFCMVIVICCLHVASAQPAMLTIEEERKYLHERLLAADAVVLVETRDIENARKLGIPRWYSKEFNFHERAKVKILKCLKGDLEGEILVYSGSTRTSYRCVQGTVSKGKSLLMLSKTKDGSWYAPSTLYMFNATDEKLRWPNHRDVKPRAIKIVLEEVQRLLEKK